jgi:hypothetical protein
VRATARRIELLDRHAVTRHFGDEVEYLSGPDRSRSGKGELGDIWNVERVNSATSGTGEAVGYGA